MPFSRIVSACFRHYWRFSRGLVLIVSGAVFDAEGRVLLVRSDTNAPWRLPGGYVEKGEDVELALARCLATSGIEPTGSATTFAIYAHPGSSRVHVALLVLRDWRQPLADPAADRAATDRGHFAFMPATALPEGTDPAVRARLAELDGTAAPSPTW